MRGDDLGVLLLEALTWSPAHGTLIAKRVAEATDGNIRPHSSRVYEVLRTLVRDGLVERCVPKLDVQVGHRIPREYRLTARGWKTVHALRSAAAEERWARSERGGGDS